MMLKQNKFKILKNQKGILTLDFIFAIIMMFCFSAILFAFAITFTSIEVAQYATFASARAYFAAHKTESEQQTQGKNKFDALIKSKTSSLGTFYKNGWFTLSDVTIKDYSSEFSQTPGEDSDTFVGARAQLVAKILQMKFPGLGSTTEDDLSTNISSYLMREPTEQECSDFNEMRFDKIMQLKAGFGTSYVNKADYAIIMDDGC